MSHALAAHPDREQLARFRRGALPPEEVEEIASHVDSCASCCSSLKEMPNDSLVCLVRQSLPAGAEEQPGLPADLIDHPRYEVLELLGSGGMGSVYKARHRLMDRLVALKVIRRRLMDRPGVVERFRREVKAAAELLHPNIVTAHDADQAGATHFLVMEFVEGVTLAQCVAERGPLPVAEACDCVRQAALALQHAHDKGMVHRDIKPHNLMLTPSPLPRFPEAGERGARKPLAPRRGERGWSEGGGRIKILDFGLARFASEVRPAGGETFADGDAGADNSVTTAGMVLGTVEYVAPEQLRDPHAADIRADIYGLGRTLMFLLTGHPPSCEDTPMHLLTHNEGPTPPARLNRILDRMLAADPDQRYQTPAEVAAALAPFTEPRPRRRRPIWLWLALALLLGGGGLTAAVYRIATDKGEIVIETEDPDIEVLIRQGGKEVTVIDPKTRQKIELRSGSYEIALSGAGGDLRLSTSAFTLKRGEKKIVTVKHAPPGFTIQPWQTMTWEATPATWSQVNPRIPIDLPIPDAKPKPAPPSKR
jgi:hypothetical protein